MGLVQAFLSRPSNLNSIQNLCALIPIYPDFFSFLETQTEEEED